MNIKLYNTLSRKLETFKPINKNEVKIYTCGPTVYWYQHIGNMRAYLFADILKRVLIYNKYKIKHVINITDVGHLTDDGDSGEDKMEKGARREGKTAQEIALFYESIFKRDIEKINIIDPDIWARASEHIIDQIDMVKILEKKGYTYRTSDGIYFDVSRDLKYGELSNLAEQKQIAGARVGVNTEKKHPQDFALWKFESKGERRQMVWKSPWGNRTFPGWHIECSAMAMKYLGDKFDIHTGGVDHIGVHHTNEIAQNKAITGHRVVKYWMHLEHLVMDKGKMAKSTGGIITLESLINKGYDPLAYRYLILTAHYRHKLKFSWKSLESAQITLKNIRIKISEICKKGGKVIAKYKKEFLKAINNDLDTPKALVVFWKLLKSAEKPEDIYMTVLDFDRILGLDLDKIKSHIISGEIKKMMNTMDNARKQKKYDLADKIRLQIEKLGYKVLNTKDGSKVEKI
jgi:cysteinyl-tRNA synthetase